MVRMLLPILSWLQSTLTPRGKSIGMFARATPGACHQVLRKPVAVRPLHPCLLLLPQALPGGLYLATRGVLAMHFGR